jgi:ssDNA-binding Zn-finger/Zn-ribbon topoisomerase 1
MADEKPRGTCPVCGRSMQLRRNGSLRVHGRESDVGNRFMNCSGTGSFPVAASSETDKAGPND